jgi:F-type H+-transporting ATPase subunit b
MRRRIAFLAMAMPGLPGAAMAQGMPQLDFKNPLTTSHVLWGIVIFVLLYLLLSRWALPQVAEVLEMRATAIARDLDAARVAKTAVDAAIAELTEASRVAQVGAQAEVNRATDAAKAATAEHSARLNERLEAQLAGAEQQIAAARATALGALRQVATETAMNVVSRLTGVPADQRAVDEAVGAALMARGPSSHGLA